MKLIAIMQPTYLPWMGYFDLIDSSDVFVFYDDVQFEKQSWQTRNRIKTHDSELVLSVSVKSHSLNSLINEVELDSKNPWRKKHLKAIQYNYAKSNFFKEVFPFISNLISQDTDGLSTLNTTIIIEICKKIGIKTEFIFSSDLQSKEGQKDIRLVNICKELGAEAYLSPLGSANYIEASIPGGAFDNHGIQLYYHNFKHPVYHQIHNEFKPYMCILDLLFNEGFENALTIIRYGRQKFLISKELEHHGE